MSFLGANGGGFMGGSSLYGNGGLGMGMGMGGMGMSGMMNPLYGGGGGMGQM